MAEESQNQRPTVGEQGQKRPQHWAWRHLVDAETGGQGVLRVAFQGEHGAYSEEATLAMTGTIAAGWPAGAPEVQILPERTLFDVYDALQAGRVACAVVPVENSQAGSVNDTYDLLLDHHAKLTILAAYDHRVRHCLMGLPGQSLADIRQVYSHPQALAQCMNYLRRHELTPTPAYDTAGSAQMIRQQALTGCAAIASRRAADLYHLTVLATDIQTNPVNITKFLLIGPAPAVDDELIIRTKTSLVFGTSNQPGSLYQALGPIARSGLNMTRLESRPSRDQPWEYIFYVDVETGDQNSAWSTALDELRDLTRFFVVLGSYPLLYPTEHSV